MTDSVKHSSTHPDSVASSIPAEQAGEIRRLTHDLSNALEIIVQTSYLLATVELQEPASEWMRLLDQGVQQALKLNQELRDYVRSNSTE
ncbi:MAG: hypothetical protein ACYC46_08155 [Acidobacteriaceae bacterium]